jgi:hypothetical protein
MPRLVVRLKGMYMHDASRSKVHSRPCRLVYFWPNAAAPHTLRSSCPTTALQNSPCTRALVHQSWAVRWF